MLVLSIYIYLLAKETGIIAKETGNSPSQH